jgi:hypothetical protein
VIAGCDGSGGSTSLNPATSGFVGVNTMLDTTNRLAVVSPASLLNHDGSDHRLKINKSATASMLFQAGLSGRAEFGLTSDNDCHIKVSSDGSTCRGAVIVVSLGDATRVWSGASGRFTAVADASPARTTWIGTVVDLDDVLRRLELASPVITADDVHREAQRRSILGTGTADLISCLIKQMNAQIGVADLINVKLALPFTEPEVAEASAL